MKRIARISVTPVKGFGLEHPEEVSLGLSGVEENRRFFLVDSDGQRLRSSQTPWPTRIRADYNAASELLRMQFPDGTAVEASALAQGERIHSTSGTITVDAPSWTGRGRSRSHASPDMTCGSRAPTSPAPA